VHRVSDAWSAAVGITGVVAIGILASGDRVSELERDAFTSLNEAPHALGYVLIPVMQAGSLPAVLVAGAIALAARRRGLPAVVVLAGGSAWLLAKVVKAISGRGRPIDLVPEVVIRGAQQAGSGFPSGHATVAAAMATVAGPYLSPSLRMLAWAVVALVALARVYVGAHLPLDSVGGVLLGWGLGSLINLAAGTPATRVSAGEVTP
jgi:glycosyltransferase 2 family protein